VIADVRSFMVATCRARAREAADPFHSQLPVGPFGLEKAGLLLHQCVLQILARLSGIWATLLAVRSGSDAFDRCPELGGFPGPDAFRTRGFYTCMP
jgi:hypothetical protein